MPGFFLTDQIKLACAKGGQFAVTPPTAAVLTVANGAVLTADDITAGKVTVSGCGHNPICTGMTWTNSATSVSENGTHILLQAVSGDGTSDGVCVPPANGKLTIVSGLQFIAESA